MTRVAWAAIQAAPAGRGNLHWAVVDGEAKVFDHPISSIRVFFSTIKRPEKDELFSFTLHRDVPRLKSYPLYSCAGICQDLMVDSGSLPSRSSISSLASGNPYPAFCFDCRGSWLVLLAAESCCLVPFLQVLINDKPAVTSSQTPCLSFSAYRLRVPRKLPSRPIFRLENMAAQCSSGAGGEIEAILRLRTAGGTPESLTIFRVSCLLCHESSIFME
jgi:hypothetical protein